MTVLLTLAAASVVALLQTTWLAGLRIGGAQPDLVLVILTWLSHYVGTRRTQLGAFAVGVFEDVLSLAPLGFHACIRLVHSAFTGLSHGNVRPDGFLGTMLLTLSAVAARVLATIILLLATGEAASISRLFTPASLIEAGMTVAVAPPLFFLSGLLVRRYGRDRNYR